MLRTHTCGELGSTHVGASVTLCGWVDEYRDHAGIVFVDLRDRYGLTQIKFALSDGSETQTLARGLRHEDVIRVTGEVVSRPADMHNSKLATGAIEVRGSTLELLNKSKTPPFQPNGRDLPNEELRLTYRYLDLRRAELQRNLEMRHKLAKLTRDYFDAQGFLEIETPMLGKSTPEGARDYLVPSRVHPGHFYALPQSPQIYKQILMVAGYDRYYQIARCFRDEDLRADRQPEFTQIDVEMAFVEREDILSTIDGLISSFVSGIRGQCLKLPLQRISYAEAVEKYGSDKPDLRFGMELIDVAEIAKSCGFGVFKTAIESGGRVRGFVAPQAAERYSRKDIDGLTDFVKDYGAKGLAFFRVKEGKLDSPIAKFFGDADQQALIAKLGAKDGDLLFFVADQPKVTTAALGALRTRLGKELKLYDPNDFSCFWVLDFPLVTWNAEENRWDAEHHPFCSVYDEDVPHLKDDPSKVRALSYDLVCNGYEAASGSIRIHDPKIQQRVFDLIGISEEEAENRFSFLLDALRYGAPPHGGIALGLDRWVMLFAGGDNIRDVIAFPKTQKASDLLSGAPGPVDMKQLRDLHIKTDLPAV
ncbi:MAG: aspartate--tRNA ligase [Planctomycetota bacterium]|nr:aspartate--tRNA ligase [Planctomycetaceae bacterium]MDQ3329491.1 aspartate--tRNA ligase [Planctomycetota bacterium]